MTNSTPTGLKNPNANIIKHPRFNELYDYILMCQELSSATGEANCMALEGCTGAGKTTLLKTFANAFNRQDTEFGVKIPVFYMETPSPVTVKGMASRMLEVLGDPAADRGALWSMNSRLIRYIKACEVQLVILDDIQHLIDDRGQTITDVSEWIKVLIKETEVPFLIVGQEGQIEQILKANEQLSRLFAVRETLRPFHWDTDDGRREFAAFIQFALQSLGLTWGKEIPTRELMFRLHYATGGVVANIMNLLHSSAWLAQKKGTATITLPILSAAFKLRLARHVDKSDPFTLTANETFAPPAARIVDPPGSVGAKGGGRKSKIEKPSEVITKN